MHPLRIVYNTYILQTYGIQSGRDKNIGRTEIVAQKVTALGLDYDMFVHIACTLWHKFAISKGWKYPYWNVVSSDNTFKRLHDMLMYADVLSDDTTFANAFASELAYALDYIRWLGGVIQSRPEKVCDTSIQVRVCVAEYICDVHGLSYITSSYNQLYNQLLVQQVDIDNV